MRKWPDGMKLENYKNYEKWSGRRWAWEFLARNEEFRQRCDDLPREGEVREEAMKAIARSFGLKKFKAASDRYKSKKSKKPDFNLARWWNTESAHGQKKRVTLLPGQVLFCFDTLHALKDEKSLTVQLAWAKKILKKKLRAQLDTRGEEELKVRAKSVQKSRLSWLRLLDAKFAGIPDVKALQSIYPHIWQDHSVSESTKIIAKQLTTARQYADVKYLFIYHSEAARVR